MSAASRERFLFKDLFDEGYYAPTLHDMEKDVGGVAIRWPKATEKAELPIRVYSPTEALIAKRGLWRHLNIVYIGAHNTNINSENPGLTAVYNTIWAVEAFRENAENRVRDLDEATSYNFGGIRRGLWQLSPNNQAVVVDRIVESLAAARAAKRKPREREQIPELTPDELREMPDTEFGHYFSWVKAMEQAAEGFLRKQLGSVRSHDAIRAIGEAIQRAA